MSSSAYAKGLFVATRKRILRGDRLRQVREIRGLTQEDLADRIDIGQSQLARYEAGKADPSLEVVARFSRELAVSTDWLLGLANEPDAHLSSDEITAREHTALAALRRGDLREYMRVGMEETKTDH